MKYFKKLEDRFLNYVSLTEERLLNHVRSTIQLTIERVLSDNKKRRFSLILPAEIVEKLKIHTMKDLTYEYKFIDGVRVVEMSGHEFCATLLKEPNLTKEQLEEFRQSLFSPEPL